jgi:hypothetical protein
MCKCPPKRGRRSSVPKAKLIDAGADFHGTPEWFISVDGGMMHIMDNRRITGKWYVEMIVSHGNPPSMAYAVDREYYDDLNGVLKAHPEFRPVLF